ncbi:SidA/IucD/PvdA family monooxygenase, partial [Streptomyces sp. JV181]|uniref:SidA/IucD/PvdA family monooxygenase n=1 Tax=Streptomyces sp. JV181 TaxID=858635 RepID=UPI002E77860D
NPQSHYPFNFADQIHIHPAENHAYSRWVSEQLHTINFEHQVYADHIQEQLSNLAVTTLQWTLVNYVRPRESLYRLSNAEHFHSHRAEYEPLCRRVSEHLPTIHFDHR